jgi:sorbitol-specific phosphotransferase system component IIA
MATKSAKSEKKPIKRKRAIPLSFKKDDKVDSIVKEITENLKNNSETEAKLEEEVKLEVRERIGEAPIEEKEEEKDAPIERSPEEEKEEVTSDTTDEGKTDELSENLAGPSHSQEEKGQEKKEGEEEKPAVFAPDKTENPFPPLEDEPKKSFKWPLIYFILFLAGMIAGFVVFDQLSQRTGGNPPIRIGTSAPTPTKVPAATPTEEPLDLSKYTIMLENGSGTAGVAAGLQTQLEDADFNVVEIGNADNSNYEETVIQVKNGTNTEFLDALREELEKTYVVSKDTEELPDSEEFDAVVIIGSQTVDE